jgi:sRNA-binding regulator protein Hfq
MPMPKPKFTEQSPVVIPAPPQPAAAVEFSGQRRLIRPNLAMRSLPGRSTALYGQSPALTSRSVQGSGPEDSSHAEVFYFQKQIQAQTRMVVVLENGEQMEGVIEWYDRYAIKLRNLGHSHGQDGAHNAGRTRVLVYKDSIRYIYKAGENAPQTMS